MITIKQLNDSKWSVLLDGRVVGKINLKDGKYRYFPGGIFDFSGDDFATLTACVKSLD